MKTALVVRAEAAQLESADAAIRFSLFPALSATSWQQANVN
ncbi:MAG: hypothetical protein OES20_16035 [Gammaproteobacteria bacterium]|nr:hypothetical protein [Gammaproteobacteria bacterium]